MSASTMVRLGLAMGLLSLGAASCSGGDPASPAGTAPAPVKVQAHPNTPEPLDYVALRKEYGAPNKDVRLNPMAIDVERTTSRNSVKQEAGDLVFSGQGNGWIERLTPGHTLYCSSACGGRGFLRNVVAVEQHGTDWVVFTEQGNFTDVVQHGWIHAEIPLIDQRTLNDPRIDLNIPLTNNSITSSAPLPAPLSGKVSGTVRFTSSLEVDIAVSLIHGLTLFRVSGLERLATTPTSTRRRRRAPSSTPRSCRTTSTSPRYRSAWASTSSRPSASKASCTPTPRVA